MNIDENMALLARAGVLAPSTAEKLAKRFRKPSVSDLLLGIGFATVVLSALFVLVANWRHIPYSLKISLHALVNAWVVVAMFLMWKKGDRDSARFKFLMALASTLTLTFIALIDATFRMHWSAFTVLFFWLCLMLPFWIAFANNQQKARKMLLSSLIWLIAVAPKLALKYADKLVGKYTEKYLGKAIPAFNTEKWLPQDKIAAFLRPVLLALCLSLPVLGAFGLAAHGQINRPLRYVMRIPVETYDKLAPMNGDYVRFRFVGPDMPDQKYHDYYIPHGKAQMDRIFSHPEGHALTMEVHMLEGEVMSYDMLYIDDMPWQTYLQKERDLCSERMGAECK